MCTDKQYGTKIQNLYLVGLMGTGKSTIGKIVANQLCMPFVDSDDQIERASGMSVSEIFSDRGEPYFRMLEEQFICNNQPKENSVISCGGGLCIPNGMMRKLKDRGKVFCLWASVETLLNRMRADKTRPLLQVDKPLIALSQLLSQREQVYRKADLVVETDNLSPEEVATLIIKAWVNLPQ